MIFAQMLEIVALNDLASLLCARKFSFAPQGVFTSKNINFGAICYAYVYVVFCFIFCHNLLSLFAKDSIEGCTIKDICSNSFGEYRFSTDDLISGAHLFHLVTWVEPGRYWCASQSRERV